MEGHVIIGLLWLIWCLGCWAVYVHAHKHKCDFVVRLAFWTEEDGDQICQDAWYQCDCGAYMRSIDERSHARAKQHIGAHGGYIIAKKEAA